MINLKVVWRKFKWGITATSIIIAFVVSYSFVSENYFEISKNLDIFASIFRELNVYYVDETNPGKLMKKGIDAMLESCDPYTNYISEADIEDYRFMQTGQYGGIGASVKPKGDLMVITDPYEGWPAQKADIKAGDILVEVEGKPVKGKTTEDISKVLKGQAKTSVKLTLKRDGEPKLLEKTIIREEIKIKSVPYFGMIEGNTGYIKLTSFTENCGKDVKDALTDLKAKGNLKTLVFDLRGNPGGLLNEAINIVNLFVDKGQEIVITKGKVKEWEKSYKAVYSALDMDIPIVVLVNSGSASASEIVSGSLQDLDRAVVLGQRSFGKGLVQTTRPISYNAQLKVTTAKYYIPSGRCIQALDYSHRNEDGSVGHVPDSLITSFKTLKSKRTVYNGGGITPDVKMEPVKLSPIAQSLVNKMLIFDYATKYARLHPTIDSAIKFEVTDADFNDFLTFLADKDYDYTTKSETKYDELKEASTKDKYFDDAKAEFDALKNKIKHNKTVDIQKNKEELMLLMKEDIVSRYYYQNGRIEATLHSDPEIKRAIEILKDSNLYSSILAGTYKPADDKK
ncbi:MAG: S41 family peptidase [Bacteroidota bacterium]